MWDHNWGLVCERKETPAWSCAEFRQFEILRAELNCPSYNKYGRSVQNELDFPISTAKKSIKKESDRKKLRIW